MIMNRFNEITEFDGLHYIEFEDLESAAAIVIETQNSRYRFTVTDVAERRGYLSGGSLGEQAQKAILLGTIYKRGEGYTTDPRGLKTGARALFYLETPSGMKHLVTSLITELAQVKTPEEQKYLF
jgi:hypothetical protein